MGEYRAVGSSRAGVRVRSAEGKDGAWANIGSSRAGVRVRSAEGKDGGQQDGGWVFSDERSGAVGCGPLMSVG